LNTVACPQTGRCCRGRSACHQDAGVVDQVPSGEVVRTVEDDVVSADKVENVLLRQTRLVGDDLDIRIECDDRLPSRLDLGDPDPVRRVQHLALEVGVVDHVVIDDPEGAHPGSRQVQRGRRTQAPSADQQHPRLKQLPLPSLPDLRDQQVSAVATPLFRRQGRGYGPGLPGRLPAVEASGERDDVAVAKVGERLRGKGRPPPPGAVDDDRSLSVGGELLDPELEEPAGDMDGPRHNSLFDFVALPHIEHEGTAGTKPIRILGVDLPDLGSDPAQEIAMISSHRRPLRNPSTWAKE
jgi:hypothetical protein